MNRNRWTTLGLGTALVLTVALSAFDKSLDAQDKAQDKAPDNKDARDKKTEPADAKHPFAGKVILIQRKNDPSPSLLNAQQSILMELSGFVLEDASFTEIGGIRFLTGHGIERVDGKPAGPRISLPLETVGVILEFDDLEAYKQFEEQQIEKMNQVLEMDQDVPLELNRPKQIPDA